jgi:hypothetical protein
MGGKALPFRLSLYLISRLRVKAEAQPQSKSPAKRKAIGFPHIKRLSRTQLPKPTGNIW